MSVQTNELKLIGWDRNGVLQASVNLDDKIVTLSGNPNDCDVFAPQLGQTPIFAQRDREHAVLTVTPSKGRPQKILLNQGITKKFADIYWTVVREDQYLNSKTSAENQLTVVHNHSDLKHLDDNEEHDDFLVRAMRLMAAPMNDISSLATGLGSLVELIVHHTVAKTGMLVMYENRQPKFLAWEGLSDGDAHTLWDKIPQTIAEDILRQGTRLILPEDMQTDDRYQGTIFIRGIQSACGFPIMAEGKVLAILVLGFDNILRDLTENLQARFESLASIMGLVIQRAMLREQLNSVRFLQGEAENQRGQNPSRLLIGESAEIDSVYQNIRKLAPTRVPVLINGETGTGKELVARELHRFSQRRNEAFVVVNAAALPENLIESELFGHAKGAFTGALSHRAGLIEQAANGTLFIDEIGEMPLSLQAKLLRVLQEKVVRRLGENQPRPVDFRLLTATNRKLPDMIRQNSFREDLYYRINGATIALPPLRDRRRDIILLANYFKNRFAEFHGVSNKDWSHEAIQAMLQNEWQGNVRELENTVERALVMADGPVIRAVDLDLLQDHEPVNHMPYHEGVPDNLAEAKDVFLRRHLAFTLEKFGWRKTEAAKALGIGLRTLFRYLEQLNLSKHNYEGDVHE